MKYMMDLDSGLARTIFSGMIKHTNFVIVETITLANFCPLMNLLTHLGFNTEDLRTYNTNFAVCKDSKDTVMTVTTGTARNIFEGFMRCIKLPNKKMCDICNYKKNSFRQCFKCKNNMCFGCFKNHNKDYISSCPYCRYNVTEHGEIIKMIHYLFGDGIEM